ncbi:MAG: hypothetical protein HZY79_16010 [Rhodoblastus sp.]|nr:MAG: hypothetical protein HZY79_16010 [Rhodoblastus sp.]
MRRAALVALTLAAFGAAGGSVAARAQAPSPAAPAPVGTAAPRAGAALDPTPSAQTPAPLTPAQAPVVARRGERRRRAAAAWVRSARMRARRPDAVVGAGMQERLHAQGRGRPRPHRGSPRGRSDRARARGAQAPHLAPRPAQLDFFFAEQLGYGDVVMTDKGARVYIGKSDDPPRREDFVPLDDPRSPRRALPARLKRAPQGL